MGACVPHCPYHGLALTGLVVQVALVLLVLLNYDQGLQATKLGTRKTES